MANQACRDYAKNIPRNRASHAGLLLDCYLKIPAKNTGVDDEGHPADRLDLLKNAESACRLAMPLYEQAFNRYLHEVIQAPENSWNIFQTKNRIVINLSQASVLETNLALHHTYGVPFIPGTALKGLVAHYCHHILGEENDALKSMGEYHRVLFGTEEARGHITFHDAWVTPGSVTNGLAREVMTPHHSDYYSGSAAPTDFDSPIPITFLTITGDFLTYVTCDSNGEESKKWIGFAMKLLEAALKNWGVGGKTNAGYGLMSSNQNKKENYLMLEKEKIEKVLLEEKKDKENKKSLAYINSLPNFDQTVIRSMHSNIKNGQKESSYLLAKLKNDCWQGEEKIYVARLAEFYINKENRWKPQSQKKNPSKDKNYQDTLSIIKYLKGG